MELVFMLVEHDSWSLFVRVVVVVVAAGLVEEHMVCLGQQHFENKSVVVATAVMKDSTI